VCRDLPALLHALEAHLRRDFAVASLRVLARGPQTVELPLLAELDADTFAADIQHAKARCLPAAELGTVRRYLGGQTASAAILPLATGDAPALLLLGAHDAERFSPDLGTLLLERLAQLVGAHWHRLAGG
jgi:uncharacterized protein YigA (DUF484 family)